MWDNEEWAARHLRKGHPDITTRDAWEVVCEDDSIVPMRAYDQFHFPPFVRHWTIGRTALGRELLVVWETWRGKKHLISAYPASAERKEIYERLKKKQTSGR